MPQSRTCFVSYQEFNTRCKTGNAWDLASCPANRLPLESGSAKNLNQSGVPISSRSLRIALRIQTNRDAPTICRQFAARAWGRKAPQTVDSPLQPALQNAADDG